MSKKARQPHTKIKMWEQDIELMLKKGKTYREISTILGFRDKYVVKSFIKRKRRKSAASPQPKEKVVNKDKEIERLTMENKLLRDFLDISGRM